MTTGYKTTRPKGYAPWTPRPKAEAVVKYVKVVLQQYAAELPLTLRQIFYLLVANCGYEKSEKGYKALGDYMVRARRARMIPFESIRDDGCKQTSVPGWSDPSHMIRSFIYEAKRYEQDKRVNQRNKVYVLVEAQGMVPQVERLASPYGVVVVSSGGFDSLTAKKSLADSVCAIVKAGDRSTFLHVGDYDPSGVCIYDAIKADVEAFVEDEVTVDVADVVEFRRVAVTPEQIAKYHLPTAPPKATDKRGNGVTETCQAEALRPDVLAGIVREAIAESIDEAVYEEDCRQQETDQGTLGNIVTELEGMLERNNE